MYIKLYHGSPSLFKTPYTYMSILGAPADGVGFHCANCEEDVRDYWLDYPISYLYEYIFSPRNMLPYKMDRSLTSEVVYNVKRLGFEMRPSEFSQWHWSTQKLGEFIDEMVMGGYNAPTVLYNLAERAEDPSIVCRAASEMGFSHLVGELPDERGGHFHFIIFDASDLTVSKIIQKQVEHNGLELDITTSVMQNDML